MIIIDDRYLDIECGGLNKNDPHKLTCWNNYSPGSGTI